jgi:hypothetical protein
MLTLCGCERNPYAVVPISGTVTFNGKPVGGIRIAFEPTVGRASFASTDAKGKFRAWYKDKTYGVQKGKVNVIFEQNLDDSVILGQHAKPSTEVEEVLTLHGHGGTPIEIDITGPDDDLKIDLTSDITSDITSE